MRYLTEPRNRKYIERYGFLLFTKIAAKRFDNRYGQKVIDTATKTGMDVEKQKQELMLKRLYLKELFKKQRKQQVI